MWQGLYDELKDRGFVIIAVALDSDVEAARHWFDLASPDYPVLIDRAHRLADLYNLVNVPQAVWIDETGRIVRPPETAGYYDSIRFMDMQTMTVPAEELEKGQHTRKIYLDAIRDWVENGEKSRHVMDAKAALSNMPATSGDTARAHVLFRLGQHLFDLGQTDEAKRHLAEASELHPDSWAIWRQAAEKNETGLATNRTFLERVAALGDKRYYPPPDMDGMS